MKTAVIAITLISTACLAQTYVTNYVKADPSFRIVDSKLYNIQRSVLWEDFKGECLNVLTNGVVLQKFEVKKVYKTEKSTANDLQSIGAYRSSIPPTRHLISETKTMGQKFIVRNYPTQSAATGQVLEGKALRVGTMEYRGATLELWDFGTPNIVPVVTKAK